MMPAWLGRSDWGPSPKLPRATNPLWLVPASEPLVLPNPLRDGTFQYSQPGGCLRDWGGSRPQPAPSLSHVGLSGGLASSSCSLRTLTLLEDPVLTPSCWGDAAAPKSQL